MTVRINRIAMDKCECYPGVRGGGALIHEQVKADEVAIRLEIERRHDAKCQRGHRNRKAVLAKYAARAAGRCHGCGQLIGDAPVCPACNTLQASSSQRGK